MLKRLREARDEDGFTLIELMVVVLIISILIAIAIPTFLGARSGAQDRAAQSNLRNAHTAAKTSYANAGDFEASATALVTELGEMEPSLEFGTAAPNTANNAASGQSNYVQVAYVDDQEITLTAESDAGDVYAINEVAQAKGTDTNSVGTWYRVNTETYQSTAEAGW